MFDSKESYVLITPARNEEAFIEQTIQSVISQTILPLKWIIVSDNSTDHTCDIVNHYKKEFEFIELLKLSNSSERNYASKVNAFNSGQEKLKNMQYQFIGNLDADITFADTYYQQLINEFHKDSHLGIAGGFVIEKYNGKDKNFSINLNSVGCAVQFFRRECFEQIGGYLPLKMGGEDAVAENMAKMYGWKVRTFKEIKVYHHRPMGSGNWNSWKARFNQGQEEYLVGYHPLFFLLKSLRRLTQKPYVLGSILTIFGYCAAFFKKEERPVSKYFVKYLRQSQKQRMIHVLKKPIFHYFL